MHRKQKSTMERENTQMLTWKTRMWEKPQQPTSCRIHSERRLPLAPLLCHAAVTTEATTSLSLSRCHTLYSYTLYTNYYKSVQQLAKMFALSHIYTYDFRAIYTYGPKGPTIGRMDHHRVLDHPVLPNFPSGGTCFPTHLERLDSQKQSTAGWLTPSDDLTQ